MKNKRENGEVVVEASIVVTLVVIIITVMLYIGMLLYQRTVVSIIANQTAQNISQVYSNTFRDPFTGYIDPDCAYQSVTYGNMKTDAYLDTLRQKGTAFTQYRLKKSQILSAADREVNVQIVDKPNEILKSQIVVTVTEKYDVPLVGMFGVDNKLKFGAVGRADCVDYLDYLFGVEAISDPENSPIQSLPKSDACIVTFVKDKYSGAFHAAVPVLHGKSVITSKSYSHSVMPTDPELNGMQFSGWFTEDGKMFSATTQINENMTVYGSWDCLITFDPTGGTVAPVVKTVEYSKTAKLPTPAKEGFEFLGWYSDVEYSTEYSSNNGTGTQYISDVTVIPGNITLYAKWSCIHAEFEDKLLDPGNCITKSTWQHKCKTCGYSYVDCGAFGGHIEDDKEFKTEPSCTTDGWVVIDCKVCKSVISEKSVEPLGHRYAGENSGAYDEKYHRDPTCQREEIDGSRCSRCGAEKGKVLAKSDHAYSGRCGVVHEIEREIITNHRTDAGYQYSTKVECLVCKYCGEPYYGWRKERDKNGEKVAYGVICRQHYQTNPKGIYDDGYYSNTPSIAVYGEK